MKTVWVVRCGCIYEGGDVYGVYAEQPTDAFMEEFANDRLSDDYKQSENDFDCWDDETDFVSRREWEVK